MPEPEIVTTGEVEKMQIKQARNGGEFKSITLKGQRKSFYDWEGHCEAAGITPGDTVKIEHDGSEFPRVTGLEKVEFSESTGTNENEHQESKGERAVRMCALECAARVLQSTDQTATEITRLAERLEKWILG